MHIEQLRQSGQRAFALDCRQGRYFLERRCVCASGPHRHFLGPFAHSIAGSGPGRPTDLADRICQASSAVRHAITERQPTVGMCRSRIEPSAAAVVAEGSHPAGFWTYCLMHRRIERQRQSFGLLGQLLSAPGLRVPFRVELVMANLQSASDPSRLVTIDEIVRVLSHRPTATTRERKWSGVTVDMYAPLHNISERYPALDHHLICYCPTGSARLVQGRDGRMHESLISAGISMLMPAGYDSLWEGSASATARLRIPTALVAAAGEQLGRRGTSRIEIRNVFTARDLVITHIAEALMIELTRAPHPAQALIVDCMSSALAAHLLRSYNAFEPVTMRELPALSPAELGRLAEYIDGNLDGRIGLAELAGIVNVSRFHFARLFKQSTGMTAISYVEQCRIHRAQTLILETCLPLSEIALMAGFADQSHFTRRFHRQVGCTPAAFARKNGRRRTQGAESG